MARRGARAIVAGLLVAATFGTGVPVSSAAPSTPTAERPAAKAAKNARGIRANIRRTKYGIPHIRAGNIRDLAAGYAYAFSEDNICAIAAEYVTVDAKRSRFFGPDGNWYFSGNGTTYENIDADIYFKWVKKQGIVEDLIRQKAPIGPVKGVRRGVAGYVRGYNAYLRRTGVNNIPDPACRGEKWVRPIKQIDVYRRFFQLGILASSGAVISGIATAAPTGPGAAAAQQETQDEMLEDGSALSKLQPQIGSNAYAFGKEATQNGRGLVYGNPHFPWDGSERFYQAHLTVPGKIDVAGGSLFGVPLILIGHTKGLAWSHTVATAWRFTPFKLQLGDSPYEYIVDGVTKQMEKTDVTVKTVAEDGTKGEVTRPIYSTEYGPMVTDLVGIPLPWGSGSGFALGDINATNFRYLNHFFANNKAQTVEQYDRIQRRFQGIPWVNSIAADSKGEAYYSMQGAIPYVDDAKATTCNVGAAAFDVLGLPILDGSRSDCNWDSSDDAVAPGTFPPDDVPTLFRDDYVHNGNDSHWLTNPEEPITGADRIIGIEEAERTPRTRVGLIQIEDRLNGSDGLPGNKFNLANVKKVALKDRVLLGEEWRDGLVQLCDLAPPIGLPSSGGQLVDVSGACDPLREWDLTDRLDSPGSVLFRRIGTNIRSNFMCLPTGLQGQTCPGENVVYQTPYLPTDPVHTPSGLNILNPLVSAALADGVSDMNAAGLPLDSALRGVQGDFRGDDFISIGGGPDSLGVFNVISAPWRPAQGGYRDIVHGSSFIMAAEFTGRKSCSVRADTFVTYSQTANPDSPHFDDYTRAFSKGKWLREPFCGPAVRRATLERTRLQIRRRVRP